MAHQFLHRFDFTDRFGLRQTLFLILLLAIMVIGISLTVKCAEGHVPYFGAYHDDGIYSVCAKSIATGNGYRILSLPMEPYQTKYTGIFPLILSLAFIVDPTFPSNVGLLQGVACLCGLMFAFGSALLLVKTRRATPYLALVVVAATWFNLQFVSYLPVTMAELPFAAFTLIGLWLCERLTLSRKTGADGSRLGRIGSCMVAALAVQMPTGVHAMGVFFLVACLIYFLMDRNYRMSLLVIAVYLMWIVPGSYWIWLKAYRYPPVMVYYTNYREALGVTAQHIGTPARFVLGNIVTGFVETMYQTVQLLKWYAPVPGQYDCGSVTVYGGMWLVLLLGLYRELAGRRTGKLIAIWVVVYSFAHLFWPRGIGARRLLVVLPFAYYYLFMGCRVIGGQIKRLIHASNFRMLVGGCSQGYPKLTACLAILASAGIVAGNLRESCTWGGQYAFRVPPPPHAGASYTETSEFTETYEWIKTHTKMQDVIVWNNDPMVYLMTGRKAIMSCLGASWGIFVHDQELIGKEDVLQSICVGHGNYLIIDPISSAGFSGFNQIGAAIQGIMADHPGCLKPVFTSRWGLITVFRIDRKRLNCSQIMSSHSSS